MPLHKDRPVDGWVDRWMDGWMNKGTVSRGYKVLHSFPPLSWDKKARTRKLGGMLRCEGGEEKPEESRD